MSQKSDTFLEGIARFGSCEKVWILEKVPENFWEKQKLKTFRNLDKY